MTRFQKMIFPDFLNFWSKMLFFFFFFFSTIWVPTVELVSKFQMVREIFVTKMRLSKVFEKMDL